jgi:quercetin dioxygenase-like cupin family protein
LIYNALMKRLFLVLALLFSVSLPAQAPTAVPIPQEPHHHLVLENDYVRVFRVSVPAHESTLLHQHDVPYLYVSLGPADVINAVQGRPEAHLVMTDGQLGYSPGHFAHIARNESAVPFNNVTIELLKPQGESRNICEKIVEGPLGSCTQPVRSQPTSNSQSRVLPEVFKTSPLFETDGVRVVLTSLAPGAGYHDTDAKFGTLFVVGNDSILQIELSGGSKTLHGGEILWLPRGGSAHITSPLEDGTSHYWVMFFKDGKTPK